MSANEGKVDGLKQGSDAENKREEMTEAPYCNEGGTGKDRQCSTYSKEEASTVTPDIPEVETEKLSSNKSKKKKKRRSKQQTAEINSTVGTAKNHNSPTQVTTTKSSFEEELDWCIAQLELGMLRPGASRSQKQQNEKSIHTLQASKTAIPKKRQLMRSLFGDYRSKMKLQPLPESLVARETKVEPARAEVIETVGTYYRHSTGLQSCNDDSDFKFNFNISSM